MIDSTPSLFEVDVDNYNGLAYNVLSLVSRNWDALAAMSEHMFNVFFNVVLKGVWKYS